MRSHVTDAIWLNESDVCTIEHIAERSGLSLAEIHDLVDSGVIVPAEEGVEPPSLHLHHIVVLGNSVMRSILRCNC